MNLLISSKHLAYIILTVSVVATFLTVFFFTYASKIEEEIVINQMNYITSDLLDSIDIFIPDQLRKNLKAQINTIKTPDLSKEDKEAEHSNKKVLMDTVKIIVPFLLVSFAVVIGMSYMYDFSLKEILVETTLVLFFVAIIEYLFLTRFAKYFISADVNFVKHKFVSSLQHHLQK